MRASETTRALLLRSVDYGEADRVVTLLTERFGKTGSIARGAKRSRKRFGGALSPLCVLTVELRTGNGELKTLVSAQIERSFMRLLKDLEAMNAAFAAIELLRAFSADDEPDPQVFALGCELLALLDDGERAVDALVAAFTLRLLALSGLAPQLDRCGMCGKKPRADQAAELDVQQGHLVCRDCGGASYRLGAAMRARMQLAATPAWPEAARTAPTAEELAVLRRVLDAFVQARIGRSQKRGNEQP